MRLSIRTTPARLPALADDLAPPTELPVASRRLPALAGGLARRTALAVAARRLPALTAVLAVLGLAAGPGHAAVAPHHSWSQLSFSNGWAPAIYDTSRARIVSMRQHLYAARDPGTTTRELMFDLFFGLRSGTNLWLGDAPVDEAGFEGDTGIVRVVQHHGDLVAVQHFFSPFGVDAGVLVATIEVTNTGSTPAADAAVFSLQNLHVGSGDGTVGEQVTWIDGAFEERGAVETLVLQRPLGTTAHRTVTPDNPWAAVNAGGHLSDRDSSGTVDDAVPGFEWDVSGLAPGDSRSFGVIIAFEEGGDRVALDAALAPLAGKTAAELLDAARADWAAFVTRATEPDGLSADERAVYRRSLAVLRMAQVQEPNTATFHGHGQIVASLPPGIWNRAWVRDGAYAILALARAGLLPEAHDALTFLLEGQAGTYQSGYVGVPYALSVCRYWGDGTEESDWNEAGPNIEFDGFGMTLAVLEAYLAAGGDRALLDDHPVEIFGETANVLLALMESTTDLVRADSSIWETHWDDGARRHFAYTQAAAVWGLRAAAALAERRDEPAAAAGYRATADTLATAIADQLVDGTTGVLRASTEETSAYLDGAVVEAFNWGAIPADGPVARATLDALRADLWIETTGHGYRRNDEGGEYDQREWILIDLRIARAARAAGRATHADELLAWVTAQARLNFDVVPENFDPQTADYAGEVPMAGFGGGAYALALFERADFAAVPPAGADAAPPADAGPDAGGGPDAGSGDGGGCGCQVGGRTIPPGGALVLCGLGILGCLAMRAARSRAAR